MKTQLERDIEAAESRILMTRFQQLSALYQEIIESPKFTGRLQDDYLDCLVDIWRAIKKMYGVKNNDDSRSNK